MQNITLKYHLNALSLYVTLYEIWYHLYSFKNKKNSHGGMLLLVKLQASASKSITHPWWVFFMFFKLHKWCQFTQITSYYDNLVLFDMELYGNYIQILC